MITVFNFINIKTFSSTLCFTFFYMSSIQHTYYDLDSRNFYGNVLCALLRAIFYFKKKSNHLFAMNSVR